MAQFALTLHIVFAFGKPFSEISVGKEENIVHCFRIEVGHFCTCERSDKERITNSKSFSGSEIEIIKSLNQTDQCDELIQLIRHRSNQRQRLSPRKGGYMPATRK